jgi:multicomponent Na+:H+ antiporter subunit F
MSLFGSDPGLSVSYALVIVVIVSLLLTAAAVLALVRIERGPSMLDRTVAFDLLATTLVGAVALEAWWTRRPEAIPILVSLSLVGFIGSATIARFAAVEPDEEKRILSDEEAHAERTAMQARWASEEEDEEDSDD